MQQPSSDNRAFVWKSLYADCRDWCHFAPNSEKGKKACRARGDHALSGTGNRAHLTAELFKQSLKLDLVHVPFNGGGPAVVSVLAGHTPVLFGSPSLVAQHVKEGKLRALAIMTNVRSQILPDVPTMAEAGYPGIEGEEWDGVVTPAGTPKDIIALLNREIVRIMAQPDIRQHLVTLGFDLVPATTPEAFAARIKSETEQWGNVIRASNLKSR